MSRVRDGLTARELDVIAAWWHVGTVRGAAELLGIAEQTAKNDLWTARLRSGAPTTLALAQMYAGRLPSLAAIRRRARKMEHLITQARATFAEATVDNLSAGSVLGPPSKTSHNMHFHETEGLRTPVSRGDGYLGFRVIHDFRHDNVECPVQSPSWRAQPFDLHADCSPARLVGVPLPLIDRLDEVERTAIPEVQPRPSHPDSLLLVAA